MKKVSNFGLGLGTMLGGIIGLIITFSSGKPTTSLSFQLCSTLCFFFIIFGIFVACCGDIIEEYFEEREKRTGDC